ncbi:hypothetical protein EOPP23_00620 [Endozoicomonas sp. OPT23]|uniref:hypothetical protein n=1 Tax=Endozoicomonas sp. OPT23 TaxID=2072845 RepID=UPI00129B801A|nr:hypothetical protein [Endozoicomonas sp. OPT23]MRI31493.1 hypothetical protein [Endozoicomonas sp. OPT23]
MIQFDAVRSFLTEQFSAKSVAGNLNSLKGAFRGMLAEAVEVIKTQLDRMGRKCVSGYQPFQKVTERSIAKWNVLGKRYCKRCERMEQASVELLKNLMTGIDKTPYQGIKQQREELMLQVQSTYRTVHGKNPDNEQFNEIFRQLCDKAGHSVKDYMTQMRGVEIKEKKQEIEGYMKGLILAGRDSEPENAEQGYQKLRHAINQYFFQFEGSYPTTDQFNDMITDLCELIGWEPDRHREELFQVRKPELKKLSQRSEIAVGSFIENLKKGKVRRVAEGLLNLRETIGAKLTLEREGRSFSAEDLGLQAARMLQKKEIIPGFETEMQASLKPEGEAFSILKSLYELSNKNYPINGRELGLLGYAGEEAVVSVEMVPLLFADLTEHYFPGEENKEQRQHLQREFIKKVALGDPSLKYTDMFSIDFQSAAAKG